MKQRINELEYQQREDREALRRLGQVLQGSRRNTRPATSGDAGAEIEPRVERSSSELECRVFERHSASMEPGMGEDVGATSPQSELGEYTIVGRSEVEGTGSGDVAALVAVDNPLGRDTPKCSREYQREGTEAGRGVGGPRVLSEQQQQQGRPGERQQQQQQQQAGHRGAGRQQQQQQHERQQGRQQTEQRAEQQQQQQQAGGQQQQQQQQPEQSLGQQQEQQQQQQQPPRQQETGLQPQRVQYQTR